MSLVASIISEVCLDFIGLSCIYPVNISTARKIAVFPEVDCGRDGIISTAQDILGPKMKSEALRM